MFLPLLEEGVFWGCGKGSLGCGNGTLFGVGGHFVAIHIVAIHIVGIIVVDVL